MTEALIPFAAFAALYVVAPLVGRAIDWCKENGE